MTNTRQCYVLKLKNKNCQNIKRPSHSFYICRSNAPLSLCLFIFSCYIFDETIFNIILCILITKLTVILNFNFSHTISSVVHSATLRQCAMKEIQVAISNSRRDLSRFRFSFNSVSFFFFLYLKSLIYNI